MPIIPAHISSATIFKYYFTKLNIKLILPITYAHMLSATIFKYYVCIMNTK